MAESKLHRGHWYGSISTDSGTRYKDEAKTYVESVGDCDIVGDAGTGDREVECSMRAGDVGECVVSGVAGDIVAAKANAAAE